MTAFSAIDLWRCSFPLRLPFSHHLAARTRVDTLILRIRDDNGNAGFGQALPRAYLTGEDLDGVEKDIRERWWPWARSLDFSAAGDFESILDRFRPLYREASRDRALAAYSAVESGVVDLAARAKGIAPDCAAFRPEAPLVGVISGGGPRRAYWTALALRLLGYRRFKIKVGLDARRDRERLAAVRRAAGKAAWLAVDANGAWGREEAEERMREFARAGVRLVEEPLRPEERGDWRRLEELTGVATMADESLCSFADGEALVRAGGPGWWNIRFGKNGGFAGMRALARLGREHGVRLYGGVLVGETSVLAAAGRMGMGLIGAECCEYGFPRVLLRGDPFRGGPGGFSGRVRFGRLPVSGLGVRLEEARFLRHDFPSWHGEA